MNVGSTKEKNPEKRISITPETTKRLINLNFPVFLEQDYGKAIGINDEEYKKQGANFLNSPKAVFEKITIILKVTCPTNEEINLINENSTLIGQFNPI